MPWFKRRASRLLSDPRGGDGFDFQGQQSDKARALLVADTARDANRGGGEAAYPSCMSAEHLLSQLRFPARYERVVEALGPEVARLLVSPGGATIDALESVALAIVGDDEGLLCPLYAEPGTGKTTLAHNLGTFLGSKYGDTLKYDGPLTAKSLETAVAAHRSSTMATNDDRITPINIDSRETFPPDQNEMAEIKQFVRTNSGSRTVILWPTTVEETAKEISSRYSAIVGGVTVDLPIRIDGPPREAWRAIAADTLRLVNGVESLEELINVDDFDPDAYPSIGQFLRAMSKAFQSRTLELLRSTRKPLALTILFGSESTDAGVLSQLTSGTRYGLLDGGALVGITSQSAIGKWWASRPGVLTQSIVQLDAHAFAMSPTTTVAILRHYGDEDVRGDIAKMTHKSKGAAVVVETVGRSDIGRHLVGTEIAAYEARGNPGDASVTAFALLVENGLFSGNRDRLVNKSVAEALGVFLEAEGDGQSFEVRAEKQLEGTTLIPDVQVVQEDITHCIEFAWRKGDYLLGKNRANAAAYILEKLKYYAIHMGWATD